MSVRVSANIGFLFWV